MDHERLTDGDDTFLCSRDRTLEHQEVILHNTVVREATHRRDGLLRDVRVRGSITRISARADAVNLLVEFRTMVVTVCKTCLVPQRRKRKSCDLL